ncbi:MAG: hypothetical protein J6D10_00570, partial [Clostridia bacterium]|nr:hypothetical protein [Clostridia bacterium]
MLPCSAYPEKVRPVRGKNGTRPLRPGHHHLRCPGRRAFRHRPAYVAGRLRPRSVRHGQPCTDQKRTGFHRELGLLYFEEPGGFRLNVKEPFLNAVLHEKVLRMVKRDRSHPSLVIYNLMNESGDAAPDKLELELKAMKAMHQLDPSRVVLRTSAWAKGDYIDDQSKIHMRPYDSTIYWNGWYDYHRAGGPAVWNEALYKGPDDYYNNTTNQKEIVFFGEEGAVSSPPRLEKNMIDLKKYTYLGWDSKEFIRWYKEFEQYIDDKNLRSVYPTVDD